MFTGIVQASGRLARREAAGGGLRLTVEVSPAFEDLTTGESVAINGVCLTVEAASAPDRLVFFLSPETLARTALGECAEGEALNIERAMRAGDRLGGHFVLGHADGVGAIRRWEKNGEAWDLEIEHPADLAPMIAEKGSVTVDGISLTVAGLGVNTFTAAIVPHTVAVTNLAGAKPGRRVNLEADVLARYVARALAAAPGVRAARRP